MSSSGLVRPSERSVRDAHVTGNSGNAPLPTLTVPRPWARSPFHSTSALRSAMAMVHSFLFLTFELAVGLVGLHESGESACGNEQEEGVSDLRIGRSDLPRRLGVGLEG